MVDRARTTALRLIRVQGITMQKLADHLGYGSRQAAHRLMHSTGAIPMAKARRVAEVLGAGLWDVVGEDGKWR